MLVRLVNVAIFRSHASSIPGWNPYQSHFSEIFSQKKNSIKRRNMYLNNTRTMSSLRCTKDELARWRDGDIKSLLSADLILLFAEITVTRPDTRRLVGVQENALKTDGRTDGQPPSLRCDDASKWWMIDDRWWISRDMLTRANTGHAVLRSKSKPPKMRRRNGPTDRPTDGRTDGQTLLVLCRT